jgi:hypothetical protein
MKPFVHMQKNLISSFQNVRYAVNKYLKRTKKILIAYIFVSVMRVYSVVLIKNLCSLLLTDYKILSTLVKIVVYSIVGSVLISSDRACIALNANNTFASFA